MEKIPLPSKIEFKPGNEPNSAVLTVEPCYPGYGITLGNALRRILLSSLEGAAVKAFKIKGVLHEFSHLDYIKEDMVELSLNLKLLRLKILNDDESVRLELKAKGKKKVTAKDIKCPENVEIANTDLLLATLTDKNADLEMEIIVNKGRGYVPTESQKKEELEVGMIAIDSLYNPVKKIGIKSENVRVGQMTTWDKLILNIETDGTISAEEVLKQALDYLISHFECIRNNFLAEPKVEEEVKSEEAKAEEAIEEKSEKTEEKVEEPKADKPKKRGRPKKSK